MSHTQDDKMEKIVSLCKRRGFIFQGSEIYGGLAGTFDYGPMGVLLKENVERLWLKMFRDGRDDVYGMDAAILMNPKVWEASGHVAGFSDPMSECATCHHRFRTDQLSDQNICPDCGGVLGEASTFNMMFKTHAGASEDDSTLVYLRPETAGGIFANYKNVIDSFHPKLPFGIAQIGKAFRNEIAPRDFIFRLRELQQMEVEYFVRGEDWKKYFEEWKNIMEAFAKSAGIDMAKFHPTEIAEGDLAHYSKRTIDFEFEYPFGRKELWGLAYRTDFDLSAHGNASGENLAYLDDQGASYIPHVIEPSLGLDRTILAILLSAYREDTLDEDVRVYLALSPSIAPIQAAVFPLLKNKPELVTKARVIFENLKKEFASWRIGHIVFDDNGNIGKRYRRQDEIGTPFCVTIDFETLDKGTVTIRDRDSGAQERVAISDLAHFFAQKF